MRTRGALDLLTQRALVLRSPVLRCVAASLLCVMRVLSCLYVLACVKAGRCAKTERWVSAGVCAELLWMCHRS